MHPFGGDTWRLDLARLGGFEADTSSCSTSYLAYDCYADQIPGVVRTFQYGGLATLNMRSVMVGFGYTEVSHYGLIGYRWNW